jgi:hypothetical protein
MPPPVSCTCRSHCSKYNAEEGTYTGSQLVTRTTQYLHRKDDAQSKDFVKFATRVASTIPNEGSHLRLSRGPDEDSRLGLLHGHGGPSTLSPLSRDVLSQELLTIEREVHGRATWTPTNQALVFAVSPVPDQDFEDPLSTPNYIPNNGPHSLSPSHQRNLAFIENEDRLFGIVLHLASLTDYHKQRDVLAEMVINGLREMMNHKRCEWNRQRGETTAINSGFVVVHTG